jgi:hypothetical protein
LSLSEFPLAVQHGLKECDVVEIKVDDLTATSLGIALNRTAELAEWDTPALAKLLEELRAEDSLAGVGFDESEIDELLDELAEERRCGPLTCSITSTLDKRSLPSTPRCLIFGKPGSPLQKRSSVPSLG